MAGGKKYNLVPETGVKMPSATDLGSVYINGMFYNILNVKVSEIISQSTGAIAGETWTCPQENEVIPVKRHTLVRGHLDEMNAWDFV